MCARQTVAFSKAATNLFFHILTRCNLHCRHCYVNPAQHGQNTLPLATVNAWLGVFARRSAAVNVVFLGGEPTLHPELAPAVKHARRLGVQSVTIDTNGYLFHRILEKVTPREVDYFSFSLDGATAATNDAIRGRGSYDRCLGGIRSAVAAGFHTSLIYTVSGLNIHELESMPPLLEGLGVRRFFIQVIGIRGQSARTQPDRLQVSKASWLDKVPAAAMAIARRGIAVTYPKVFLEADEIFECAGRVADNYFVFPNGRVYRCPLCEDFAVHSLRIEENRLMPCGPINENDLFQLQIPEGCVMNKLIQPGNLSYRADGSPAYRVACCLLKEEIRGS